LEKIFDFGDVGHVAVKHCGRAVNPRYHVVIEAFYRLTERPWC
jgi:hypothetical protein